MMVLQQMAHLFYWLLLFVFVYFWQFVLKLRVCFNTFVCLCNGLDSSGGGSNNLLGKEKQNNKFSSSPPLRHIAFHLDDRRYVNEEFVSSLVRHCAEAGIGRLTLSDSWSTLVQSATITTTGTNPCRILTTTVDQQKQQIVMKRLANTEGREQIVRACKELSMSDVPVTADQLGNVLADYADQPDFFVRIGSPFWRSATLASNAPLAIRLTEFYCVVGFFDGRALSDREFNALLGQFSSRVRRFGR